MKTIVILALVGLAAAGAVTPTASAEPVECPDNVCTWECIQVYPWSRLCEGDVMGFLEAYLGEIVVLDG